MLSPLQTGINYHQVFEAQQQVLQFEPGWGHYVVLFKTKTPLSQCMSLLTTQDKSR